MTTKKKTRVKNKDPQLDRITAQLSLQGRMLSQFRSVVPPGVSGDYRVEQFEVKMDLQLMRMIRDGRGCSPGTYTRLLHKKETLMADTDAEIIDFLEFVEDACGRVLVAGLGLGVVVQALLNRKYNDCVDHITVVEKSADVIRLVAPYFPDNRLKVVNADIFSWRTNERFNFSWYDIWDDISGEHVLQIDRLKRRFAEKVSRQYAWCEELMRSRQETEL